MNSFGIRVYQPLTAVTGNPVLVPASLTVQPQSWSAVAKGGMWDATIAITGPLNDLTGLTAWIGYRVEIINERGTPVWWGDIATVEITASGVRKGISLDRLANRVMLRYTQTQPGGGVESVDTAWTNDTASQTVYGIWERRITPEREMSANEATALQATALTTLRDPHYTLAPDSSDQSVLLTCTGYWQRTKRLYDAEVRGLEEHNVTGTAYPLGLGIVSSNQVAFSKRAKSISQISSYFKNFDTDMRVKVTGAFYAGNNTTYTVTSADDRDAVVYSATDVVFSPADDIQEPAGGLGFIETDDVFHITDSATTNAGTHIMDKAGAVNVEVSGTFHGATIVSETADVTFYRGNAITVTPTPTNNELLGATVTATVWGQRYYQTFALSATGTWTVDAVELRLCRVGGPADNVQVQLYTDSGGAPNTLLKSATVAADDIPLEMGWVSFDFDNAQTLTYGTTYGLVVSRTGANDWDDFYQVDLDDGATYAAGTCKAYDGAAYQTLSPACDLIFRVLGGVDTGTQAASVLYAQSWLDVSTATSGVVSNQHRDGELRAYDELEALLDTGTSAGARLLARTTKNFSAIIYAKPIPSTARFAWQAGDKLTDLFGRDAEPGILPAGEWVKLGDASTLGPWAALSPAFIERAEYSPGSGWSLEPEGFVDQFDTGAAQG